MPQSPYYTPPTGSSSQLDVTAAAVVKASPGRIGTVNVTTAGTTTGAIYDASTTSGDTAANLVAVIPEAVGSYVFSFPCLTGILIVPGTSQVLSVSFQ